jgi:hypothetical protein
MSESPQKQGCGNTDTEITSNGGRYAGDERPATVVEQVERRAWPE